MNAVLGFAGLPVTLGALAAGKRLALANKESLIAAAPLVAKVRDDAGRRARAHRLRALRDSSVPRELARGLGYPDVQPPAPHRLGRSLSRVVVET